MIQTRHAHLLGVLTASMLAYGATSCGGTRGTTAGSDAGDATGSGSTDPGPSTGTSSTLGGSSGAPPGFCETRQQAPDGTLVGETDVQAICEDGELVALHRPGPVTCTTDPASLEACTQPGGDCETDADCDGLTEGGGTCASSDGTGGGCSCILPCNTDSDCPADRACVCRSAVMRSSGEPGTMIHVGSCYPASCRADADCGPGGQCGLVNPEATCVRVSDVRLSCRGLDGCQTDSNCDPPGGDSVCFPSQDGTDSWACGPSGICG